MQHCWQQWHSYLPLLPALATISGSLASNATELSRILILLDSPKTRIKDFVSPIEFSCLKLWLHKKTSPLISRTTAVLKRKLIKLGIAPLFCHLDTKVIFNFSQRSLTPLETRMLLLGLEFRLPIYKFDYFKYRISFEKLHNTFCSIPIYDHNDNSRSVFTSQLKRISTTPNLIKIYALFSRERIFAL